MCKSVSFEMTRSSKLQLLTIGVWVLIMKQLSSCADVWQCDKTLQQATPGKGSISTRTVDRPPQTEQGPTGVNGQIVDIVYGCKSSRALFLPINHFFLSFFFTILPNTAWILRPLTGNRPQMEAAVSITHLLWSIAIAITFMMSGRRRLIGWNCF